jgi:glycosyltransferase involved in cell wall biosynthesis
LPLKVLSIAFPFAPVGLLGVGGAEQILSDLDHALVASGHTSIVIACQGSQIAGTLIPVPLPSTLDEMGKAATRACVQDAIDSATRSEQPDLIHMHGLDFHQYSVLGDIPAVVTLHMPIPWYPATAWTRSRGPVKFVCVSDSQRRTCPAALQSAMVIENGVAIPPDLVTDHRKHFALVLGRICPEKNAHEALQAGTRAGVPVLLAGRVFPYRDHQQYFADKIAPLLQSCTNPVRHQFLGPVSPDDRNRLLSEARCLLHPTLAPETSSLAAMEALAAGTPVIAYRSGALSDIVEHGVSGFLVGNVAEMADAIANIHIISPDSCHRAAELRFNKTRMISSYLELYEAIVRAARPEALHA